MAYVNWSVQHLQDAHGLAMRDHLHRRSVAILLHNIDDEPQDIGSGTCVQVGERHFIATAGHVIKDAPTFRTIGVAAFGAVGQASNETPKVVAKNFRFDDDADVGWLELEPKAIPSWMKQWARIFVTLDRVSLAPVTDANAVACLFGQPSEDLKVGARLVGLKPLPYFANFIPTPVGSPSRDLYVRYERDMVVEGTRVAAPKAFGMSGAGVWLMNQHAPGIWTPDLEARRNTKIVDGV